MSKFQKMLIILYIVLSLINIPFVFFINVLSRYAPVDSANMSISYMTNQKFSEDSLEEFINEIYRITPDILGIYIYDENLEIRLSTNTQLVGETIDAKTVSDYAGITRWLASHSSDPKFSATRPLHMAGRGASLMIGNERLYPLIYAPTQAYSSNIVNYFSYSTDRTISFSL